MKKVYFLFILTLFAFLLVACSDKADENKKDKEPKDEPKVEEKVEETKEDVCTVGSEEDCVTEEQEVEEYAENDIRYELIPRYLNHHSVDIMKFTKEKDSYDMELFIKNKFPENEKNSTLYLGYSNSKLKAKLLTTEGVYQVTFDKPMKIKRNENKELHASFKGAKGTPIALTLTPFSTESKLLKDDVEELQTIYFFLNQIKEKDAIETSHKLLEKLFKTQTIEDEKEVQRALNEVFGNHETIYKDNFTNNAVFGWGFEKMTFEYKDEKITMDDPYNGFEYEADVLVTFTFNGKEFTEDYHVIIEVGMSGFTGDFYLSKFVYENNHPQHNHDQLPHTHEDGVTHVHEGGGVAHEHTHEDGTTHSH